MATETELADFKTQLLCRAYLVVKTKMAPAFNSMLAPTAEMAIDSTVSIGRGQVLLSSEKKLPYGMATSASKHVSCIMVTASLG